MPRRECRNQLESLCGMLCAAGLIFVCLWPCGVAAYEIDSIRAIPTSAPSSSLKKQKGWLAAERSEAPDVKYWGTAAISPSHPSQTAVFQQAASIVPDSQYANCSYGNTFDAGDSHAAVTYMGGPCQFEPWTWQVLPQGLVYRSYLANNREPRFGFWWVHEKDRGWLWDVALGGRMGLLRYGTTDPLRPEGWELDIEGAAFPRLKLDSQRDMIASDFRFGVPLTYRRGRWEFKLAFYHLSSHLADEYMLLIDPDRERINYSRDVLTLAAGYFPTENIRLYAECGWGWYADEGSDPWEFQFGIEYSPLYPNGIRGNPFVAINTRLRQEVDYGGNMSLQAGWQWRGWSGQRLRVGMQYFNGMSDQYQFVREFEELIGGGVWYDF